MTRAFVVSLMLLFVLLVVITLLQLENHWQSQNDHLLGDKKIKGNSNSSRINNRSATSGFASETTDLETLTLLEDESRPQQPSLSVLPAVNKSTTSRDFEILSLGEKSLANFKNETQTQARQSSLSSVLSLNVTSQGTLIPTHLHLVFVGDSLTRFQYLSLAYFLERGDHWVTNDEKPSPLVASHHSPSRRISPWTNFYNASNLGLNGHEDCDCYRSGNTYTEEARENRYYRYVNSNRNNHLTYLSKFGSHLSRGLWNASSILSRNHPVNDLTKAHSSFAWNHSWVDLIRNYIVHLQPKPRYVVLNAGLWDNHGLDGPTLREIRQALDETSMTGIYKTTTAEKGELEKEFQPHKHDLLACNSSSNNKKIFEYCLDLSWTKMVLPQDYVDNVHFVPSIYTRMNEQLLELIQQIEINSTTTMDIF